MGNSTVIKKDKKVILLNILGIKSADELDKIKVDTDYIMDVETRINSLFENSNKSELGDSNVIFSGLDDKRKELLHNIVDEIKERLEDEKDEEGFNSILSYNAGNISFPSEFITPYLLPSFITAWLLKNGQI